MDLFGTGLIDGTAQTDVETFLSTIHPSDIFEIRSLDCPERRGGAFRSTASGYFSDRAAAAKSVRELERLEPPGIYCTLNAVLPELLARSIDCITHKSKTTASDGDIARRCNLLLDIDADKRSGISATDAESAVAIGKAIVLRDRLRELGWPDPIFGMSGNGASLLYKIDLPVDADSLALIERLYKALNDRFEAGVDVKNANAARITKILGTMARKGGNLRGKEGIEDRPHRRSWYCLPASYELLTREQMEAMAGESQAVSLSVSRGITDEKDQEAFDNEPWMADCDKTLDIQAWINEHAVPVSGPVPWNGGQKWVFTELPPLCHGSPSGHTDFPSSIIQFPSGAISANCLHGRCTWKWEDLRKYYEPGAYERSTIPVRPDLYVEHQADKEATREFAKQVAKPRIGSANKHVEKANNVRKQLQKLYEALIHTIDSWEIRRVLGDEHRYRLSGAFFESRSSPVDYLEIDFDRLMSFDAFNRVLGKWRTGKNCLLPSYFEKVWRDGVAYLLDKAIDIEGHNETRMTAIVAERLAFMIDNRSIPFWKYAQPDTYKMMDTESMGVVWRDYHGVKQHLIDFTKALRTLHDHYDNEITRKHLVQTLDACGAKWTYINSIKKKFRVLTESEVKRLHALAIIGESEELELAPHENFIKKKGPDFFDEPMPGVDDIEDLPETAEQTEGGDVDFNFGENAM